MQQIAWEDVWGGTNPLGLNTLVPFVFQAMPGQVPQAEDVSTVFTPGGDFSAGGGDE